MQVSNSKILSVENDDDISEVISLILEQSNAAYEITSIKEPNEALRLAAIEKFDLYIFDYRYPHMTGVDICRIIRRMDKETPIIFFCTEAQAVNRIEAMDAGADAYLVKPRGLEHLSKTVAHLLTVKTVIQII
jgi:DNA-binding response OmpR family regulator